MKTENKKIYLVTGGCGFIGSCLVKKLLESKKNFVINYDNISYASNKESVGNVNKSNYLLIEKDIQDAKNVEKILSTYKPNYVIHLAAESHVDRSIDSPENFVFSNVVGTYNLLMSSFRLWSNLNANKNKFKFIYVSTDEVYGSLQFDKKQFSENNLMKPNSPYAATKASGDLLARSWFKTYGFPVITTNSSNNYGFWQFPEKLIPLVITKCLKEEAIPIYGKGNHVRDWINVEDNVDGILAVMKKGRIGERYNIGANNEKSNLEIVTLICSFLDILKPKKSGSYSDLISFVADRPGHDLRYSLNTSKINQELNWTAKIDFKKGLKDTIKWYLENEEWLFSVTDSRYDGKRLGRIK